MENRLSTTKTRSIGIVVLPEFMDVEPVHFVELIGRSNGLVLARWRDPTAHSRDEGVWVLESQCDIVAQGKLIDVHLFAFPPNLPPNFDLKDLIFPVEIGGCLLIANCHFGYLSWARVVNVPRKRSKDARASWLAWIKPQKTPFFIIAIGAEPPPALTVNQLLDYLDLEPEIPISEIPSQLTVEQKYVYDLTKAKNILTTLVEKIITGTA